MQRRTYVTISLGFLVILGIAWTLAAQQPARPAAAQGGQAAPLPRGATATPRPPVFFHESWKLTQGTQVMAQQWVSNPNLELKLYGPGIGGADIEHGLNINTRREPDNVAFVWSGMTEGNWALTLRDKNNFVNLKGALTKIRIKSMQSGLQVLRPVIKTADGKYFVADQGDGLSVDWHEREFNVGDLRWFAFNEKSAFELPFEGEGLGFENPDLSRVDEVGFTTMQRGTGHGSGGSARVASIEVVGYPVSRNAPAKSN
jgi:hypothetical protein